MKIINFDYKKLENYKAAIDDGFIARNKISEIEFIVLGKTEKGSYYFYLQDLIDLSLVERIKEKNGIFLRKK